MLLNACGYPYPESEGGVRPFDLANTGDWLGELYWKVRPGVGDQKPNKSVDDLKRDVDAWKNAWISVPRNENEQELKALRKRCKQQRKELSRVNARLRSIVHELKACPTDLAEARERSAQAKNDMDKYRRRAQLAEAQLADCRARAKRVDELTVTKAALEQKLSLIREQVSAMKNLEDILSGASGPTK